VAFWRDVVESFLADVSDLARLCVCIVHLRVGPERFGWQIRCRDNPRVVWKSSRARVAQAAVGVALIAAGAYAVVVGNDSADSAGLRVFNACIAQKQLLVLVGHGNQHGVIETVTDRNSGALVGEVAADSRAHPIMLGGAAAATNRYVMSTASPLGRDASAIEECWDSYSPIAP
jgi:hypothetical protein